MCCLDFYTFWTSTFHLWMVVDKQHGNFRSKSLALFYVNVQIGALLYVCHIHLTSVLYSEDGSSNLEPATIRLNPERHHLILQLMYLLFFPPAWRACQHSSHGLGTQCHVLTADLQEHFGDLHCLPFWKQPSDKHLPLSGRMSFCCSVSCCVYLLQLFFPYSVRF